MTATTSAWMEPQATSLMENIPSKSTAPVASENNQKKKKQQQPRQLLSCTKCRERKVRCDRTKPCSACCARGQPKECHFVVKEGDDYGPIQQSYELRKLRAENLLLKERLRAGQIALSENEDESSRSPRLGEYRSPHRSFGAKHKRFKSQEPSDNLYFGSPGLVSVVSEFANLSLGARSLSHTMPRGAEIYAAHNGPPYPFATMWPSYPQACIPALLECVPARDELFSYLDSFQRRAQSCSFPHTPDEITKKEVERFLSDAQHNAEMYPDMLALIFAALAQGVQNGIFDKCGGEWVAGAMEKELLNGDVYIAAAMQALRMASFMNRPTLLGIQTLIMIGPYLTNSGRFLDAWTLFGTTIRLAHSIGLHRNPKYLDPAPPLKECSIRQSLWWWMLHMDQQYSMTLGRPLGISGIGDCPPPEPLTTNTTILRLGEYINQFTLLARQILSSDRLNNGRIDDFTDRLRALWDTMPEKLQFDDSWLDSSREIPEWPLDAMAAVFYAKTHNYLILLNRQRLENGRRTGTSSHHTPDQARSRSTVQTPIQLGSSCPPSAIPILGVSAPQQSAPTRGRALVLESSLALINAFLFFATRVPAALICWTMGQQAFNACMILLLDALETGDTERIWRVEQAFAIWRMLEERGVHKLAGLAVQRVSWGLDMLRRKGVIGNNAMETCPTGAADSNRSAEAEHQNHRSPSPLVADAVMGNTGMLLLEDPGLQSFVPEAFTPLGWEMAGNNVSASFGFSAAQPHSPFEQTNPVDNSDSTCPSHFSLHPESMQSIQVAPPQYQSEQLGSQFSLNVQLQPGDSIESMQSISSDINTATHQVFTFPLPPNCQPSSSFLGAAPSWAARGAFGSSTRA